ncbi:MAG: hypothetical protein WDO68_03965 [Gammaproteobacteria bacterium]
MFDRTLRALDPIRDDRSHQRLLDAGLDQVQPITCCVIGDTRAYLGSGRAVHDVQHSVRDVSIETLASISRKALADGRPGWKRRVMVLSK